MMTIFHEAIEFILSNDLIRFSLMLFPIILCIRLFCSFLKDMLGSPPEPSSPRDMCGSAPDPTIPIGTVRIRIKTKSPIRSEKYTDTDKEDSSSWYIDNQA